MSAVRILVLGYGNVGRAVVARLGTEAAAAWRARWGIAVELVGVVRRRWQGDESVPEGLRWTDPLAAIRATSPNVVVELLGGEEPARSAILTALAGGADVVTANKAVLAAHGRELIAAAREHGRLLLAEASVGGVIPILRTLHTSLASDEIEGLIGVWNGTCNYILTQMESVGSSYASALAEAQRLGYAEADPTLDVSGGDTAHKACVLVQAAFGRFPELERLEWRGIEELAPIDFQAAAELGLRPKMVGWIHRRPDERLEFYVGPALLERSHPVAGLEGVRNGIVVTARGAGAVFLAGAGAGPEPTATAVLGDLVEVVRDGGGAAPWPRAADEAAELVPWNEQRHPCYLRFLVPDRPGILGRLATILGEHGISIASVSQPYRHERDAVPVYMTTHEGPLAAVTEALAAITATGILAADPLWLPILAWEGEA